MQRGEGVRAGGAEVRNGSGHINKQPLTDNPRLLVPIKMLPKMGHAATIALVTIFALYTLSSDASGK